MRQHACPKYALAQFSHQNAADRRNFYAKRSYCKRIARTFSAKSLEKLKHRLRRCSKWDHPLFQIINESLFQAKTLTPYINPEVGARPTPSALFHGPRLQRACTYETAVRSRAPKFPTRWSANCPSRGPSGAIPVVAS